MVSSSEILAAFREVSNSKQLDRSELYALLQDGILAALAKKYGSNVQAEVNIDDGKGDIRIVLLKTVVARRSRTRASRSRSTTRARSTTASRSGDVMESRSTSPVFGRARRAGGQAAHHPARPRGRAHADPRRVRDAASATCSPAKFSRSSAASSSSC